MSELEIRALSDESLESKINSLVPTTRQRTREGGISEEAGKAIAALVPYRKEQERRAGLKKRAELDKTTAKIAADKAAERDRDRLARQIYGREVL